MRKQLGRELRDRFEAGFQRIAPEYTRGKPRIPGERLYERRGSSGFTTFIVLEPHHMYDQFTIEIGWSSNGIYPVEFEFEQIPAVSTPDLRFKAPVLWRAEGLSRDHNWVLAPLPEIERPESFFVDPPLEPALERVGPAVEDALRRVREHVLPYLEQVREAQDT